MHAQSAPAAPIGAAAPPISGADQALLGARQSHDLCNLLAVVVGVCEWLSESLEPGSEAAEVAKVGLVAAERAAEHAGRRNRPGDRAVSAVQAALGPPRRPSDPPHPPCPTGGVPTVLFVEDEARLLDMMASAFARAGFAAYTAQNGRQALKLMETIRPDLLVTDIVMPEVEGLAIIRETKRLSPDTAVIAISGGGHYGRSGAFLSWAEGLGADEVLAKPFKMSSLLTAARVVLDRTAPLELRTVATG